MRVRGVSKIGVKLADCHRCGWTYEERQMRSQDGGLVCPECYDNPSRRLRRKKSGKL